MPGNVCADDVAIYTLNIDEELTATAVATCEPNQTEYTVEITISGGTQPYSVDGTPIVGSTFTSSIIALGTDFSFNISDSGPCDDVTADGISPNCSCPLNGSFASGNQTICLGDDIELNLNLSGDPDDLYEVVYNAGAGDITVPGLSDSGSINVSPTTTTTYTLVSVSDGNCTTPISGSVTVTVEQLPDAGDDVSLDLCSDGSTLTLVPATGQPVGGTFNPASVVLLPGNSGDVTYTMPGSVCADDVAIYTINIDEELTATAVATCEPTQSEYTVEITISGGTQPYSVDGTPIVGSTFTSSTIPIGTNYNFNVSDSGPCADINLNDVSPDCSCPLNGSFASGNQTICLGDDIDLNLNLSGDPGDLYEVVYNAGAGDITVPGLSDGGSFNVSPTTTTTYTLVSVTDGNCTATISGSVTVTVEQLPDAGDDVSLNYCGDGSTLTLVPATGQPVGGTFNPASVVLLPGNSGDVTYTMPGSVCADDVAIYTLNIDEELTATAVATCEPNQTEYTVEITISGGTQPYSVDGTPIVGSTFTSSIIALGTDFSFNISDSGPCDDVTADGISPNCSCPLNGSFASGNQTICLGDDIDLNLNLSGDPGDLYEVVYNAGAGDITVPGLSDGGSINVSPTTTTTYTLVSVSDGNCTTPISGSVTVTVEQLPDAGDDVSLDLCSDGSTLTLVPATGQPVGGTFNPASVVLLPGNSGDVTYTMPGSVCADDVAIYTVNIDEELTATAVATCEPNQSEYTVEITISGGTQPYSVDGTPIVGSTFTSSTIPIGTNYNFNVSDSGPCADINLNDVSPDCSCPLNGSFASGNQTICLGDDIDLNLNLSGDPGDLYEVVYNAGAGDITVPGLSDGGSFNVSPTTTTTYTLVSVTDGNCTATISGSVTVTVEQLPNAGADITLNDLCGDGSTLTLVPATGQPVGGTFNPASVVLLPGNSGDVTYTMPGNVCADDVAIYTLNIDEELTATAVATCEPNQTEYTVEITISGGTQPYSVDGTPIVGSTFTSSIIALGTDFSFNISDSGPCDDVTADGISPNCSCPLNGSFASGNQTICLGDDIELNLNLSGDPDDLYEVVYNAGAGDITVPGLSDSGSINVSPTTTTTYTLVSVSDGNCTTPISGSVTVTVEQLPDAGDDVSLDLCSDGSTLTLVPATGQPVGGTFNPASVVLLPGNSGDVTYTMPGSVCADDVAIYTINIDEELTATAVATCEPNQSEYTVEITISGGTQPYSVDGTPIVGSTFTSSTIPIGTNYNFNVSDSGPCADVTADGISPNCSCPLNGSFASGNQTICLGDDIELNLNLSGDPDDLYEVVYNAGAGDITVPGLSDSGSINVSPTTTTTYTLVSVSDGNCTTPISGSVTVTVEQLPDAGDDVSLDLCSDGSTLTLVPATGQPVGGTFNPASVVLLPGNSGDVTYTMPGNVCADDVAIYTLNIDEELTATAVATCEPNQTEYTVEITISGGTQPYSVDGTPIVGSTFTSSIIALGTDFSFNISDSGPCDDVTADGISPNCSCPLNGSFASGNQTICLGDDIELNLNLSGDPDDLYEVVYNAGAGDITVPGLSDSGSINVSPTTTTTYTLVSVSDGNCTTPISGSVTVTVEQLPDAGDDVSLDLCSDGSTLTLVPATGQPVGGTFNPASVVLLPGNSGDVTYTMPGSVCADDVAIYTINIDEELTATAVATCEPNQSEYTVEITISGGTQPYSVDGTPIVGSTFTSSTIPIGTNYNFNVSDSGPCADINLNDVSPDCSCPLNGSFASGNQTICLGDDIDLNLNLSGDPGDLYEVVYNAGAGDITVPGLSDGGSFNVSPTTTTTYTLVSVTDGNCTATISGSVTVTVEQLPDAGDDVSLNYCGDGSTLTLVPATGQPVGGTFNPASVVLLPGNSGDVTYTMPGSVCADDVAIYTLNIDEELTATAVATCEPNQTEYTVEITISGGTQPYSVDGTPIVGSTFTSSIIALGTDFSFNISDSGPCDDVTADGISPNCSCPLNGSFASGNQTICLGDDIDLNLNLSGDPGDLYEVVYNAGAGDITVPGLSDGGSINVSPTTTTTYTLISVSDGNCTTPISGSVTVTVEQLPDAGDDVSLNYCG